MRMLAVFFTILFIALTPLNTMAAEGITISIDKITQNDHITGTVNGLTQKGHAELKVVVYVKTNHWYIHPYEQGGDGKSWATIDTKGSWTIKTVLRENPASAVAALVVKHNSDVPSQIENLRGIPNEAIIVRELKGTPDEGKL